MKDLKGTKTLENLLAAFAGESQARNKYTYYASKAKKEGYGSSLLTESEQQKRIYLMLLKVKTTSGQICIRKWLLQLEKRDSQKSLLRWKA